MELLPYALGAIGTCVFGVFLLAMLARRRRHIHVVDVGKDRKHIVVLGGGFGGVYTAKALEEQPYEVRKRVLQDNAAELWKIKLPTA